MVMRQSVRYWIGAMPSDRSKLRAKAARDSPLSDASRGTVHGTEAFVDAGDIAAVAVETLRDPSAHDGTEYAITGPEALTVAETAEVISGVTGRQIVHADPDREEWVAAVVASGVPATYGAVLRELTATIASGHGAIPNDTVKAVTSRSPRTFAEFARGAVAAWTEQA